MARPRKSKSIPKLSRVEALANEVRVACSLNNYACSRSAKAGAAACSAKQKLIREGVVTADTLEFVRQTLSNLHARETDLDAKTLRTLLLFNHRHRQALIAKLEQTNKDVDLLDSALRGNDG